MNVETFLKKHKEWLAGSPSKPVGADANLSGADLSGANLSSADLSGANLSSADLLDANLSGANLCRANLSYANLRGANLSGADLSDANLSGANLCRANLSGADLSGADLSDLKANELTSGFWPVFPTEGEFVAWKSIGSTIIKLLVPEDAFRSNATTRKGRVSKALVLSIRGSTRIEHEAYEHTTVYQEGTVVYPDSWDKNRWNECSNGIHCFLTEEEAITWASM